MSLPLPARATWTARTSSGSAQFAVTSEFTEVWRSSDPEPWIEIDFGMPIELAGFEFHYASGCSRRISIEVSPEGETWQRAYLSSWDSEGKVDLAVFQAAAGRFWRMRFLERYGEFVELALLIPLPPAEVPNTANPSHRAALDGDPTSCAIVGTGEVIEVIFPEPRVINGLWVIWGSAYARRAEIETSDDGVSWVNSGQLLSSDGTSDNFWWRVRPMRGVRVRVLETSALEGAQISELRFRINNRDATPLGKLERAAQRRRLGLYPPQLSRWQTYWTVVGTPHDSEECLFNEVGAVEPRAKGPSFMPLLLLDGELRGPLDGEDLSHSLRQGSLPIPKVAWRDQGLSIEVEAVASFEEPVTAVRYQVRNLCPEFREGKLLITIWPHQVNPEWQHGGLSAIWSLEFDGGAAKVDGKTLFEVRPEPGTAFASEFEGGAVVERYLPPIDGPSESQIGLVSGVMEFPFRLQSSESASVEVRIPMREGSVDLFAKPFEDVADRSEVAWRRTLGPRRIELADGAMTSTLEAEVAYTLVNQNGPALQPGSRNYDRTWIRDGACHCFVLLQAGLTDVAKEYVAWYAARVYDDGLVPPILNPDGTVNRGYGSDIEFDAQGEFLFAAGECFRMSRDRSFLEEIYPAAKLAMRCMEALSEQTAGDHPVGSRYHGLFPPSISHEGFARPVHSYWDVAWALRGWEDGAALAEAMGETAVADWARLQREKLRVRVKTSMEITMREAGIEFLPSSADNAELDPTSTSIFFFPCEAMDALPAEGLESTYASYMSRVRARYKPNWDGDYTPYELRNINAFTEMGRYDEAHELMDYFMSCRRPAGWCFWAEVVNGDARYASYIGDMPHTWIGAEIWIAVRRQLVKEVDGRLHLFCGAKCDWLEGKGVRLTDLPTHFGPLNLKARIEGDDLRLEVDRLPVEAVLVMPSGVKSVNGQTAAERTYLIDAC